jgi:hypothetical protein
LAQASQSFLSKEHNETSERPLDPTDDALHVVEETIDEKTPNIHA